MDIFGFNVSLSTVVSIISALGVIGAISFNVIELRKQRKNDHFRIFSYLYEEFEKLQLSSSDFSQFLYLNTNELRSQSDEIEKKVNLYRYRHLQFHEKVAHLALLKIIPEDVANYYVLTFPTALEYVELIPDPTYAKQSLTFLQEWCKKKNIVKRK